MRGYCTQDGGCSFPQEKVKQKCMRSPAGDIPTGPSVFSDVALAGFSVPADTTRMAPRMHDFRPCGSGTECSESPSLAGLCEVESGWSFTNHRTKS